MKELPFILLVQARVKPEFLAQVTEVAAHTLLCTLKEPGCVAFFQNAHADDPCHFYFYEHFASRAAHEEHMAQPYTQRFFETLQGKLLSEPAMQQLMPLGSRREA